MERFESRIRDWDVVRAKSNRVREENGGKSHVVKFELIFGHPCFYVICACIEFFGEVGHFTERSGFLELCIIREKLMIYRMGSYDIGERCCLSGRRERAPVLSPEAHHT